MTAPSSLARLALAALAAVAVLAAPAHAKAKPTPVVTKVTPLNAAVGDTLTISGRNFLRGRWRNTVVFKREGAVAVFVKASDASTRRLRVRVPNKLLPFFAVADGRATPTRFRVRVLAARFGRRFTSRAASPLIAPPATGPLAPAGQPPAAKPGAPGPAPADCDKDGQPDETDADDDNDLLSDAIEAAIKTTPCKADSDGDGAEDGYEYVSALDLNDRALPFPGTRPFPNPLDPTDVDLDHDGDSLTLREEHAGWKRYGGGSLDLNLSAGAQATKRVAAADQRGTPIDFDRSGAVDATELAYLDQDGDGTLSDDEQDIDGDGLSNYDETHGRLTRTLVDGLYRATDAEGTIFPLVFAPLDWLEPDSDGDTRPDGADDQDHDDVSNLQELSRRLAGGTATPRPATAWVHPFNPCLPNPESRTCPRYVPVGEAAWAPFGSSRDFGVSH